MARFPLVQINVESFEYLTVIECSIYKSKDGKPDVRKRVDHIFINKETEAAEKKRSTSSLQKC